MNHSTFDQFATELPKRISQLRAEAAKYRNQRNEARQELQQLRESNAGLRHELATLRAELETRAECRKCHCQARADAEDIAEGKCPRSGNPLGGCHLLQGCTVCDEHRA